MSNRARGFQKKIWISDEERTRAAGLRNERGVTDADIFAVGIMTLEEEDS